jgi:hypothetical protein
MSEEDKKDREPWAPHIDSKPLFINSADFERRLGEASNPPDTDITEEEEEEPGAPDTPNPFIKPTD